MKARTLRLVILFVCMVQPLSAQAEIVYSEFGGHFYGLTEEKGTWGEIDAWVKANTSGSLVTIDNTAENEWLHTTFKVPIDDGPAWIGLYQTNLTSEPGHPVNDWGWTSGDTSTFRGWLSPEPNNASGVEHWATLQFHLDFPRWNDWGHERPDFPTVGIVGIVELDSDPNVVPEPSTFALWAIGSICMGFAGIRRRRKNKAA